MTRNRTIMNLYFVFLMMYVTERHYVYALAGTKITNTDYKLEDKTSDDIPRKMQLYTWNSEAAKKHDKAQGKKVVSIQKRDVSRVSRQKVINTTESDKFSITHNVSVQRDDAQVHQKEGIQIKEFEYLRTKQNSFVQKRDLADITKEKIDISDSCKHFGSCDVNKRADIPICYCDLDCEIYNDCCLDVISQSAGKDNVTGNDIYLKEVTLPSNESISQENTIWQNDTKEFKLQPRPKRIQYQTCETQVQFQSFVDWNFGVRLVSKCPLNYETKAIKMMCESLDNLLPVTASNGEVYRNVHCAICHGDEDYKFWDFHYLYNHPCNYGMMSSLKLDFIAKIDYIIDNKCFFFWKPPQGLTYRTCFKSSTDVSSITPENQYLCSKYMNPVRTTVKVNEIHEYRNIFCIKDSLRHKSYRCMAPLTFNDSTKGFSDFVMTGMFNLHPTVAQSSTNDCGAEQIYDASLDLKACTSKRCLGKRGKLCGVEYVKNFKWKTQNALHFFADNIINLETVERITTLVSFLLPERYQATLERLVGLLQCGTNMMQPNMSCCEFQGGASLVNKGIIPYDEAQQFLSDVRKLTWVFTELRDSRKIKISNTISDITDMDCNLTMTTIKPLPITKQSNFRMNFISINFSRPEIVPMAATGTFTVENDLRCRIIELEFKYKELNITESTSVITRKPPFLVGTIMSYVTLGISCISLIFTTGTYACFGLFRSSPEKISLNMMASLLTAQVVFIASVAVEDFQIPCLVVGVISHYLWLCTFSWISIFMVNVMILIRSLQISPGNLTHDQKLSKVNFFFGYMFPALIVLLCMFLELFSDLDIGYVDGICFPTSFPANLFVFTVPVVLSITINLVALIAASVKLARFNSTVVNSVTFRKLRDNIPIYIRLGVLCACPWVFGVLSDVFDSDFFRYIFILLAGSHGTFVSISFLTSRNVLNEIRRRFIKRATQTQINVHRPAIHTPSNVNLSDSNIDIELNTL